MGANKCLPTVLGDQWHRQDFVLGVHRFGVVKRPKILNVCNVVPPQAALYTPEYALLH